MTSFLAKEGNIEKLLLQWRKEYGPFFEFMMPGTPPVMVVADPEAIKEVDTAVALHSRKVYGLSSIFNKAA